MENKGHKPSTFSFARNNTLLPPIPQVIPPIAMFFDPAHRIDAHECRAGIGSTKLPVGLQGLIDCAYRPDLTWGEGILTARAVRGNDHHLDQSAVNQF